jgi:hypothetical protein
VMVKPYTHVEGLARGRAGVEYRPMLRVIPEAAPCMPVLSMALCAARRPCRQAASAY